MVGASVVGASVVGAPVVGVSLVVVPALVVLPVVEPVSVGSSAVVVQASRGESKSRLR